MTSIIISDQTEISAFASFISHYFCSLFLTAHIQNGADDSDLAGLVQG